MDEEMSEYLNKMQIKETSELYVRCSTVCFDRCVSNFTARKLNDSELSCIEKCTEKFAKMNQRLTLRLFELNREELAKQ
ncbi:Mitochondrial import inner membrane translocase subunit TIM9 [Fasciola gigantica]|uniref:Mitochondrial import inner membrane translocase subunit n=2 Tax=Fasciola TaxID=6191 RepID=A0A4E0RWG7_FASHE|nr:Mitochondrial import inner membrane translocase subunit TIM9 [Fasciola hepatica]TPP55779.1 Mitochondrial import inner membrane translocase subunit TIM9 [Fasciola gigantica]